MATPLTNGRVGAAGSVSHGVSEGPCYACACNLFEAAPSSPLPAWLPARGWQAARLTTRRLTAANAPRWSTPILQCFPGSSSPAPPAAASPPPAASSPPSPKPPSPMPPPSPKPPTAKLPPPSPSPPGAKLPPPSPAGLPGLSYTMLRGKFGATFPDHSTVRVQERGVMTQALIGAGYTCNPMLAPSAIQTCLSSKVRHRAGCLARPAVPTVLCARWFPGQVSLRRLLRASTNRRYPCPASSWTFPCSTGRSFRSLRPASCA